MTLTPAHLDALKQFHQQRLRQPFSPFPEGPMRDVLRKAGLIERWNPLLKATGRIKPWRLTAAGRAALAENEGDG